MDFNKWWLAIPVAIASIWGVSKAVSNKPSSPPTPIPPPAPNSKIPAAPTTATALTSYLPDVFFVALNDFAEYSQSHGAKIGGDDYLKIFLAESDCDSRIANSIGCAGLNQICNLKGVGFTGSVKEYISLPADQQLQFVKKYFDNVNRYPAMVDVGSLYLSNFSPAFLGKPDNFVMYRKGVDKAYDANRGVDTGGKGFIEVGDMAKFVNRSVAGRTAKFNELRGRLAAVRGTV